jgi:predicted CoA-binding protein
MNQAIERFFLSPAYAVVGVSRNPRKFGNTIFREMKRKGLSVYPVHPYLDAVEGVSCARTLRELPSSVHSVVVVVHPEDAVKVVAECHDQGIQHVWLQQGAESDEAIAFAEEHGLNLIHGQCVLMFLEPVKSFHAFHRWVNKLVGKYPD